MQFARSKELFEEAKKYMPGGVNSPVRAYSSVDMDPPFIVKGEGAYLYDADGNKYIDYVASWGPLILGHAHPAVKEALLQALENGTSFGAPTELENEMAKMVAEAVPGIEKVRMVNSGTEACMSAIRLARAFTGRKKIVKFEGCYHGHADYLLIKAGSGASTHGVPTSPGVPESSAEDTIVVPYNDLDMLERAICFEGAENIAAVILEPVAGNMGCVPPLANYLEKLREITKEYGILLIFDEVMTGFRVAYGGAQQRFGVKPDLTCLGKIIGGGLPVGAYGGRKDIMEMVSPDGPVYQAGTLSGNPLAMAAGIATLKELKKKNFYRDLEYKTATLEAGLREAAREAKLPVYLTRIGGMFSCFFTDKRVVDFKTAAECNINRFKVFFREMLYQGIYLAPSPFEAAFMSMAHSDEDIEKTVEAARIAFKKAKEIE